jgi:metacaspase-1
MARSRDVKTRSSRRSTRRAGALEAAGAGTHHVVYVHGICPHSPGYADPWWNALKPYVTDIPDKNHHEVLWSDLITGAAVVTSASHSERVTAAVRDLLRPRAGPYQPQLMDHVKDILADRAQRQFLDASLQTSTATTVAATQTPPARAVLTLETAGPRALVSIPGLECVDDFARYLLNGDVRNQVIDRFHAVARPLLEAGARLEVIGHSWGTVVAYEALRRLDGAGPELPDQAVHNFFTAGSALSIAPVKRSLLPEAVDGRRPRLAVQRGFR